MNEFLEIKELDLSTFYEKYANKQYLLDELKVKMEGSFLKEDIIDEENGEFIGEVSTVISEELLSKIIDKRIMSITYWEVKPEEKILANTILNDSTETKEEAVTEVFKKLRPGDLVTVDSAKSLIKQMFFNPQRYDLEPVGRYKLNKRLGLDIPETQILLTKEDIVRTMEIIMDLYNGEGHTDDIDVGRYKLNKRLGLDIPETQILLTKEDIVRTMEIIMDLYNGEGHTDDIDNLCNRRIRGVGELLLMQIRTGLAKMGKMVKEKMTIQDSETLSSQSLLNTRPLNALVLDFFGSGQLSQFMDQSNPLAELTHKRRISALGPGGLSRERAGFEVRDVHDSHYGRVCPIETPEGPNIGLIGSLATYAKVNKYGFIETPYIKIENGKVNFDRIDYLASDEEDGLFMLIGSLATYAKVNKYGFIETPYIKIENGKVNFDRIDYLASDEEDGLFIAQADTKIGENGELLGEVTCRFGHEIVQIPGEKVDYLDVSPKQVVSVSAGLIPFLEHDDANRALMGSNMQRQAVPLLRTEAPYVGTGIERKVAVDSGAVVISGVDGVVTYVDASKIKIEEDGTGKEHTYRLLNFERSNQAMCLHQKPIADVGERVKKGDVIADGPATKGGDLALGRNILMAFMPWEGYNYEDAILISDRLRKDDVFTSIHIEEYEIEARATKLGDEEITREIPNVSEDAIRNLDANGVIVVGAEVEAGDILVGKTAPKGETEPLGAEVEAGDILVGKTAPKGETEPPAEEKLLRAIFGEKARDVRDTSLRMPHGSKGTVVEVLELSRENGDDLKAGVNKAIRIYVAEKRKITVGDKMSGRHGNKGVVSRVLPAEDMPFLADGTHLDVVLNPLGVPSRMNIGQVLEVHLGLALQKIPNRDERYIATPVFDGASEDEVKNFLEKSGYPRSGKVTLYDGRTGEKFDNPVTVGIMYMLKLHHLVEDKMHARAIGPYSLVTQQPLGGKAQFGGQRLGEMEVWALEAYGASNILQEMMTVKSSLVTQQPLGGKAQFGGQRLGEMEVWALEAYGASNILQEMMTVKSDDINGRTKTYEAIVKGEDMPEADLPESFKVLLKEFQAIALDVELFDREDINGRTKTYEAIVKGEDMPEADLPESFKVLLKEFQAIALDVELFDREGNLINVDEDINKEETITEFSLSSLAEKE